MPTHTEAAEALYRAAMSASNAYMGNHASHHETAQRMRTLVDAVNAYRDSTPDAPSLPPEVQRVLEAAGKWWEETREDFFADDIRRELRLAVRAYRSTQPEPLSARLARLGKGARVRLKHGSDGTVEANAPQHESLWVALDDITDSLLTYSYSQVDTILSESP